MSVEVLDSKILSLQSFLLGLLKVRHVSNSIVCRFLAALTLIGRQHLGIMGVIQSLWTHLICKSALRYNVRCSNWLVSLAILIYFSLHLQFWDYYWLLLATSLSHAGHAGAISLYRLMLHYYANFSRLRFGTCLLTSFLFKISNFAYERILVSDFISWVCIFKLRFGRTPTARIWNQLTPGIQIYLHPAVGKL